MFVSNLPEESILLVLIPILISKCIFTIVSQDACVSSGLSDLMCIARIHEFFSCTFPVAHADCSGKLRPSEGGAGVGGVHDGCESPVADAPDMDAPVLLNLPVAALEIAVEQLESSFFTYGRIGIDIFGLEHVLVANVG